MKEILDRNFITVFSFFFVHQILQHLFDLNIQFIDNYLDPFCLGFMVPHLIVIEHRLFYNKETISLLELVVIVIFLTIISECLFPLLSLNFTADWIDGIAIAFGALLFVIVSKRFALR